MSKKKIIIGVHGLANKPAKSTLENWWLKSITEGILKNIEDSRKLIPKINFEILYWADMMYVKHLTINGKSPFKLIETYHPSEDKLKPYKAGILDWIRETASDKVDDILDNIHFIDYVAHSILAMKLKDLAMYWDEERAFRYKKTAKKALCSSLLNSLKKHQNKQIMLIAHSMGSIISYDTLIDNPEIKIDTFVTIGSPLGIPRVKRKAAVSQINNDLNYPTVPSNITGKWYNFADRRDPVALDTSLSEDYLDSNGKKCIKDDLVFNQYSFINEDSEDETNCHKSYGYLRCPEVSKTIARFLVAD